MSSPRNHAAVARFEADAVAFCTFIEAATALPRGTFVWTAVRHLIALYASALDLPHVDAPDADDPSERPRHIGSDENFALTTRLSDHLGEDLDNYRVIFDPYDKEDAPVTGSLADDLADVYRDLKDGLVALASGGREADVLWEWRFDFEKHWGVHALRAAYALHWITHTAGEQWISPDE